MAKPAVVLGIGNVLAGDDAFGPHVVHELSCAWDVDEEDVRVVDGGTPGFDLASWLDEARALFIVDALAAGGEAGTLLERRGADILAAPPPPRVSPHQPGLREALLTMQLRDEVPPDVKLFGVVAESFGVGAPLSEAVAGAVPRCVEAIVAALRSAGARPRPRDRPHSVPPWWA